MLRPADYVRFTSKSGHWNSVARCPLRAKSGHTEATCGHPLDDCDVHSVNGHWVVSACSARRSAKGSAKCPGYHSRTIEGAIATMTQRAGTGANSGHGRVRYDAQRQCAYELHS